jgi:outer membrane protein assembly factor BamB
MFVACYTFQPVKAGASSQVGLELAGDTDWWPVFHHDSAHTGYSTSIAPNTNQTLWTYTTGGSVDSSPAAVNGIVYIGSSNDNVYALNATTGALMPGWPYVTGGSVGSPAVVGGIIYVGSSDGNVYALNATTGVLVWKYQCAVNQLTVASGVVYVGSQNHNVYALNAATGVLLWTYTTGDIVGSSPAVSGGVVYVGDHNGDVYALNTTYGTLMPGWPYTTRSGSPVPSSPAVAAALFM